MNRSFVTLFVFSALMFSCSSSLPIINSDSYSGTETNHNQFQLNQETNIRYHVSNDQQKVVVEFLTDNERTAMTILRSGLKVYVNPENEKEEDTYLIFPYKNPEDMEFNNEERNKSDNHEFGKKWDLTSIQYKKEMIWHQNETDEYIYLNSNSENFEGLIKVDENGELYYKVVIPFKTLFEGKKPEDKVAIGFSLEPQKPNEKMKERFSADASAGMGGDRPKRGGRGGKGKRPDGERGGNQTAKFWFSAQLVK